MKFFPKFSSMVWPMLRPSPRPKASPRMRRGGHDARCERARVRVRLPLCFLRAQLIDLRLHGEARVPGLSFQVCGCLGYQNSFFPDLIFFGGAFEIDLVVLLREPYLRLVFGDYGRSFLSWLVELER